ncbi:DNA-directed RNA polymerases I and III subunit RPAC1 [Harpegnathos saltator]|uniref:DNA-directed RNA polymerases I and III subunit RPAC1 n=1 Tax=Harpegnathos saltator TaxID=610380 RepID=UPI00058D2795|nr:DNA-directed RNA polymerases I and III subunit RPAC1 [Harpegnathos saltator]
MKEENQEKKQVKKERPPQMVLGEHNIPNAFEFMGYVRNEADKNALPLEKFQKTMRIEVVQDKDNVLEFDMIGCSSALVNAFRRILLSEVPSMAIEKVYVINNTSVVQDEVLAHRLGLIPLRADPRLFEYPPSNGRKDDEVSDQDTLRYELKVACTKNPQKSQDSQLPEEIYKNSSVYSKDIKWVPIGRQAEMFPNGAEQLGVLENDILISKMRPGHEIHVYMHAFKGISKDHAKYSPLSIATYRLLPNIELLTPVTGKKADLLKSCFSPGVIEVVERKTEEGESVREALVKSARYDYCSRNVFRYPELKDCVKLTRVPDHFIFTVETLGALPSAVLFKEAVKVLKTKCITFIDELQNLGE